MGRQKNNKEINKQRQINNNNSSNKSNNTTHKHKHTIQQQIEQENRRLEAVHVRGRGSGVAVGHIFGAGGEIAVTAVCAVADAYGGASAGEMLGGDLAVTHLGPFVEPLGQGIGRNIGRVVDDAAGATAIPCPSRAGSGAGTSPQVGFAPGSSWWTLSDTARVNPQLCFASGSSFTSIG